MEQPIDVQDVRVVHFGLGPLGAAIARTVAERDGRTHARYAGAIAVDHDEAAPLEIGGPGDEGAEVTHHRISVLLGVQLERRSSRQLLDGPAEHPLGLVVHELDRSGCVGQHDDRVGVVDDGAVLRLALA